MNKKEIEVRQHVENVKWEAKSFALEIKAMAVKAKLQQETNALYALLHDNNWLPRPQTEQEGVGAMERLSIHVTEATPGKDETKASGGGVDKKLALSEKEPKVSDDDSG